MAWESLLLRARLEDGAKEGRDLRLAIGDGERPFVLTLADTGSAPRGKAIARIGNSQHPNL